MSRTGTRKTGERAAAEAEARRTAEKGRLRSRRLVIGGGLTILLAVAIVFFATRPAPEALANIQTVANMGQAHLGANDPVPTYNSNPPTSGPHSATPAPCGVYRQPIPDITQVHDLEHGVVLIQYDPAISEADRTKLEDFGRDASTHIIVAPREGLDTPVAVTAWTKLMNLDTVDLPAIEAFYGQFAQFGPERGVQCPFQIDESQVDG